jgi:acetyl-CoA carboxylase biotin carboxyl carrier protein
LSGSTGPERPRPTDGRTDDRTPEARAADHAAIDRLADELLPALVARLGATGLGELEVREGQWRVRLRRPPGAERRVPQGGRAAPGRGSGRGPDDRSGRETAVRPEPASSAGPRLGAGRSATDGQADDGSDGLPTLTAVADPEPATRLGDLGPLVSTSPAVGIYRASGLEVGARVRAGDRLATVDLLGVPQEVVAPEGGIVAAILVEDGDAVEYGQPLLALESLPAPRDDRELAG